MDRDISPHAQILGIDRERARAARLDVGIIGTPKSKPPPLRKGRRHVRPHDILYKTSRDILCLVCLGRRVRNSNPRAPTNSPLDSRYLPAPAGFRTAVFRSSAAIMR